MSAAIGPTFGGGALVGGALIGGALGAGLGVEEPSGQYADEMTGYRVERRPIHQSFCDREHSDVKVSR